MKRVKLLLVGGYLGAGKTTLLGRVAARLTDAGQCVGLITNDQADDLVDTATLSTNERVGVREVAGRCFCCGFDDLLGAANALRGELNADVLIAEPVGSCTDLSATILQPLKDRYAADFELSPLTVLADPHRLGELLTGRAGHLNAFTAYIYRKQLEEADVIAINKVDLLDDRQIEALRGLVADHFPGASVHTISAASGAGIDDWLNAMLQGGRTGGRVLEIDYDTYAAGEAALGWLNATARLAAASTPADWRGLVDRFMTALHERLREAAAEVGHVKLILQTGGSAIAANLTQLDERPRIDGDADHSAAHGRLTFNARVETTPESLEAMVHAALNEAAEGRRIEVAIDEMRCLQPARPEPTHRYDAVVE